MALIGVMRWNMDNDYMFVAEQRKGNLLSKATIYCNSSEYGVDGRRYDQASVIDKGMGFGVGKDREVFSGDEVFPTYDISDEIFRQIMDHSDDLGKMIEKGKTLLRNHNWSPLFGFEKRRKRSQKNWLEVCVRYEERIREIYEDRAPNPFVLEYNRASEAAKDAGFDGRTINGKPIITKGLLELTRVPKH